jgi:hypothetical protein
MARGGKREGAGRPKGSRDKADLPAPYLPVINGLTSLEFMQAVYQSPDAPFEARFEAAKAALPFEHAKLAPKPAAKGDDASMTPEEQGWGDDLGPVRPN